MEEKTFPKTMINEDVGTIVHFTAPEKGTVVSCPRGYFTEGSYREDWWPVCFKDMAVN